MADVGKVSERGMIALAFLLLLSVPFLFPISQPVGRVLYARCNNRPTLDFRANYHIVRRNFLPSFLFDTITRQQFLFRLENFLVDYSFEKVHCPWTRCTVSYKIQVSSVTSLFKLGVDRRILS